MKNNKYFRYGSLIIILMLSACSTVPPVATQSCAEKEVAATAHDSSDELKEVMEFQRQTLQMNSSDIVKAIVELNFQSVDPQSQIHKAILYSNLHGNGDLQRAQILLDQLLKSTDPEADKYKPVASLLNTVYADRVRLEDSNDKLAQQVRDGQKRLDQTIEKLEALKNIERQLPARSRANSPAGDAPNKSDGGSK